MCSDLVEHPAKIEKATHFFRRAAEWKLSHQGEFEPLCVWFKRTKAIPHINPLCLPKGEATAFSIAALDLDACDVLVERDRRARRMERTARRVRPYHL